jgi:hypothetical protein
MGAALRVQPRWYRLGFTCDDVIGAWQHWRLARECAGAIEAEGRPPAEGIYEAAGTGTFMIYWYVSPEMAEVLDRQDVQWRRFLVDESDVLPLDTHPALGPR